MRDAGDEFHLQLGEMLGAAAELNERAGGGEHQQKNAAGDGEVPPAALLDERFERSGAVADRQQPAAAVGHHGEPGASGFARAGASAGDELASAFDPAGTRSSP